MRQRIKDTDYLAGRGHTNDELTGYIGRAVINLIMSITCATLTRGHLIKQAPARGRDLSHAVTPS